MIFSQSHFEHRHCTQFIAARQTIPPMKEKVNISATYELDILAFYSYETYIAVRNCSKPTN